MNKLFDTIVIGAGIVGLATAMKLAAKHPHRQVALLEKEAGPARHQTGHNSGVIHSGLYYRAHSLKAKLCVEGARQLYEFCRTQGVAAERCGKLVVATHAEQLPQLRELYRRGQANGLEGLRVLDPAAAKSLEPHASCILCLHVPTTGIVDFRKVAAAYAKVFQEHGGQLFFGHKVTAIRQANGQIELGTSRGTFRSRLLVNCAGLYSDHIARLAGVEPPCRIVPFRGEYYSLRPERRFLVKNLIYPTPDPRFPFLGVHLTRMIDGQVEAGPNAVLALAREGYRKSSFCWSELKETLAYRGFWNMAKRYWLTGGREMLRSYSRRLFANSLRRLVPQIKDEDLQPGGAGVRAQALGRDGKLLDDFLIEQTNGMLHVLNAPSPAATASLAIADYLIERLQALPDHPGCARSGCAP